MIPEKILFVDDEQHLLDALRRQLRQKFALTLATSGKEALKILDTDDNFAVIVSDYRMPEIDGIQLLSEVRKKHPSIVRVMFSGNADLGVAIEAVNNGRIFRFLTKPASAEDLQQLLDSAVRQYRMERAEKDLLNNTLKGSIKMLSELLSLANPRAFSSGYRIKRIISQISKDLDLRPFWQHEVAALLSQVGCIAIPGDILDKVHAGTELSKQEQVIFSEHPRIGAQLVGKIPRLEKVAEIIASQLSDYGDSSEEKSGEDSITLGGQILRAALDYDHLLMRGLTHDDAIQRLYSRLDCYNPEVLSLLNAYEARQHSTDNLEMIQFSELVPGMVAAKDIVAANGTVIIAKGQEITWPVIQGLQNFEQHIGIREPIYVRSSPFIQGTVEK